MTILEMLRERQSARSFSGASIEPEDYNAIIESTRYSPRAGNLQHFSILAIQGSAEKQELVKILDSRHSSNAGALLLFIVDLHTTKQWFLSEGADYPFENLLGYHFGLIDAVCAAQNAALVAESLGYGTCYSGLAAMHSKELARYTSCRPGQVPFLILSIGKKVSKIEPRFNFPVAAFVKPSVATFAANTFSEVYVSSGKADADAKYYLKDPSIAEAVAKHKITGLANIYSKLKYQRSKMQKYSNELMSLLFWK